MNHKPNQTLKEVFANEQANNMNTMIPITTEPQHGAGNSELAILRRDGDDLILEWWNGSRWITFGPLPEPSDNEIPTPAVSDNLNQPL